MAREISFTNRSKATLSVNTAHGTREAHVVRNHEGNYSSAEKDILFIAILGDSTGGMRFDLDEAKELYAAVGEVIADAEQIIQNAKPKPLTRSELDALSTGSRVFIDVEPGGYREFLKTEKGDFVKVIAGANSWAEGYMYTSAAIAGIVYKKEEN